MMLFRLIGNKLARLLPFVLGALLLPLSAAAAGQWSLGLGIEYASGDYGTEETTDSVTIPLIVDWYPTDRLDFELVVPWLYQTSSTTVAMGGGRFPFREGGLDDDGQQGQGGHGRLEAEPEDSDSGLGDVTLTAGYVLITEGELRPLLRPLVYLKFPTGDEEKGLGTGEFDAGLGLGVAKLIGHWSTYLEGLYIHPGSSSEFDPDDYWSGLVAVSYRLGERLAPGVSLSGSTAPYDDAPDSLELRLKLSVWTSGRASFGGYLSRGLADGSPDIGAGFYGYWDL